MKLKMFKLLMFWIIQFSKEKIYNFVYDATVLKYFFKLLLFLCFSKYYNSIIYSHFYSTFLKDLLKI